MQSRTSQITMPKAYISLACDGFPESGSVPSAISSYGASQRRVPRPGDVAVIVPLLWSSVVSPKSEMQAF